MNSYNELLFFQILDRQPGNFWNTNAQMHRIRLYPIRVPISSAFIKRDQLRALRYHEHLECSHLQMVSGEGFRIIEHMLAEPFPLKIRMDRKETDIRMILFFRNIDAGH